MEPDLIQQGLSLMIYGMGTVFVFLTVLVFVTKIMSIVLRKIALPEPVSTGLQARTTSLNDSSDINDDIRTAIKQAITLYRQDH
jgi:oxaloacetate decarboxylase gamma subunit